MTGVLDLLTVGETLALFTARTPGRLRYAHEFTRTTGGAESNVAVAVARLGLRTGWVGRVGDDEFGVAVTAALRGEGVDVHARVDPDRPTGLFFKEAAAGVDPQVTYYRAGSAGSALSPADLPDGLVEQARRVHLTGITAVLSDTARETVTTVARAAQAAGVPVSVDANLRHRIAPVAAWRDALKPLVAAASVVLVTEEEGRQLTDVPDAGLIEALHALGPALVVVKRGADGALLSDGSRVLEQPPHPTPATGTPHGAGDFFAGGLLGGLLHGLPLERAAQLAAWLGASTLAVPGNIEGLPSTGQVRAWLDRKERPLR